MDECEHRHRVGVGSGDGEQVDVAVLHVCVCHSVVLPDGSQLALRKHQTCLVSAFSLRETRDRDIGTESRGASTASLCGKED